MMTADLVTKESEILERIIHGGIFYTPDFKPRPEALGSVKYLYTDLTDIRKYYIRLGFHLEEFDRCEYYKDFGYDNLYDFCENNLGLDKSAVSRCINVYREFNASGETKYISGIKSSGCAMELADRWKNYSYTQLCEMLPLSDEDRKKILPDMTVKQIREFKKELKEKQNKSVASTQQECTNENVPDDGEIRDFCHGRFGCLSEDERMNFKKYMVEKYGKSHTCGTGGKTDYRCTPRGIRINDSDEITWTRFAKRVKELEEQIPGSCFRTNTADAIPAASTQPEKEKKPFDYKRYELSVSKFIRQDIVKNCSPVKENVVATVFDKDGKFVYGNMACDLIYVGGGDYYFRLWNSEKEG